MKNPLREIRRVFCLAKHDIDSNVLLNSIESLFGVVWYMKDSQFGFHYGWADLQPVRLLVVTVFVAQLIGGLLGWLFGSHPEIFMKIWFGGALATFPAFLLGLIVQKQMRPARKIQS
jgi:hypothetical protein